MFPQLVANEKAQKGQAFWKFLKALYNTPSLIQRNSEGSCTTIQGKNLRIVHGYFINWIRHLMVYSQKNFSIRRVHLLTPSRKKRSHSICRFAKASMQIKLQVPSLNSHENGVLRGCFFKNSKYVYNYASHLVTVGNTKIKRGKQTFLSSYSRWKCGLY